MSDTENSTSYQLTYLYPWLGSVWHQTFSAHVQSDNFPHALLVAGINDIGKKDLAFYLAKGLLCQSPLPNQNSGLTEPCHQCRSCQLFSAGNHPDMLHVTTPEDKKVIPVDEIRNVIQWSVLSSQLNGKKVILIEPAEAMNQNAANSLLKTLEEPVPDTIILMVSHKKQSLLPTIKSRCQCIDIAVPESATVQSWLELKGVKDAHLMLSLASGAPLRALSLSRSDKLELRHTIIKHLLSIHNDSKDPVLVADTLVKLTKKNKKQAMVLSAYDIIYWFDAIVFDIARLMHNSLESVINNIDYFQNLQPLSNRLYLRKVLQLSDSINKAYYDINGSINVNLLLEKLLIDWKNCKI